MDIMSQPSIRLETLLERVEPLSVVGSVGQKISGLAYDSRQVEPGSVFFALPGVEADGFDYLPQALANGAVAVVAERLPEGCLEGVSYVRVTNVRQTMAKMAARFYGDPATDIPVIGVTGTNGKTTITYLLEAIFKQAGLLPAVFGTVEYRCGETRHEAARTTPESIDLLKMMAEFRQQGADILILEVSSHALEQYRVDGINFTAAVFTNLTQDHLDYHGTLECYFASKKRLFTELLGNGVGIVNCEDRYGDRLLQENRNWVSFGLDRRADVYPSQVTVDRDQISGVFTGDKGDVVIQSGMIGDFNLSNLLAAVATAQQLGVSNTIITAGIAAAPQVPGRVEKVVNRRGVLALVDYSHTPDALEQVLKTLTKIEFRRVLTVVGCGGDRDKGKRPLMASAAVKYSHLSIFTSDNPRTEDPAQILEQIRAGALAAGSLELHLDQALAEMDGFIVIADRRAAIELAGSLVRAGDLLLVAGKGHEDYQIFGAEKIHFDDREELDRVLNGVASLNGDGCSVGVKQDV